MKYLYRDQKTEVDLISKLSKICFTLFVMFGLCFFIPTEQVYSADITDCGTVAESGTLTNDIGSGGDCLIIVADGITIDGGGYTVNGNVFAKNASGDGGGTNGYNITLNNITISGGVDTSGWSNSTLSGVGGNGGNISLTNTTVSATIYSQGGVGGIGETGASGSNCDCEDGDGGGGSSGSSGGVGGNGGDIFVYGTSVLADINNSGGVGGVGGDGGSGGGGGSNSGNPGTPGAQGDGGGGGNGGNLYIRSLSSRTSFTASGGAGGAGNIAGLDGISGAEYIDIPSIYISAPSSDSSISGSNVTVSATASEYVGPSLSGVKFYINSTLIGSEDTTDPYSVTLDTTAYSDGSYTLYGVVRNSVGNYATSSVTVAIDNSGPSISAVAASVVSNTSATVNWTTNELSDSTVWYGTSSGAYGSSEHSDSNLTDHATALLGLSPVTRYYFIAVSTNPAGLTSTSTEYSFTTEETWTPHDTARSWNNIISSSDGTKLAATVFNGNIYTSTDSGVTWTARDSVRAWNGITSSSDGTKLAATVYNGNIYTSTDSGVTWTAQAGSGSRTWQKITSSSDGTKLAAVAINTNIYTSTDSGVTWTARDSVRIWTNIVSSSDGTRLAAIIANSGNIYTSTDSGVTWTAQAGSGSKLWRGITSSSDGTKLAATTSDSYAYTSTDSGVTWTASDSERNWSSIISSSDGTKLAAKVNSYIYTSVDSGVTWVIKNSAGSGAWSGITSSSDGTKLAATITGGNIYTATQVFSDNTAPTVSEVTPVTTTTNDTTPSYTFTTNEEGTISYGGSCTSETTSATSGSNIISFSELAEGTYTNCTVTVTDAASNASSPLSVTSFTIDTTAPTTPVVAPDLASGSDTGTSSTDNSTNDTTPTFTGTCTDVQINLYVDGAFDTYVGCDSGNFSITSTSLGGGSHSITYTEIDALSNESGQSPSLMVTIDITSPLISEVTPIATGTDTTPSYTFTTNEAGTITYGGSCTSGTASATSGSNTVTLSTLVAGTYTNCTITVTDASGNISNTLTLTSFTISAVVSDPEPTGTHNISGSSISRTKTILNNLNPNTNPTPIAPECSGGALFSSITGKPCFKSQTPIPANNTPTSPKTFKFTKNILTVGVSSEEARQLQIFLNNNGFSVSITGAGSKGKETRYFGPATKAALAKFQKAKNIFPALGIFGPLTRGYINGL